MKKALIITAVSGFLVQFEKENVRLLQDMGYEVHYASNGANQVYQYEERTLEDMQVHFHWIDIEQSPVKIGKHRKAFLQLLELIEQEQFRLIHCHTPVGGVLGRMAARHFAHKGIKVIYTVHGFHFYKGCNSLKYSFFYGLERYMATYTDALVTINQEDYKAAERFPLRNHGRVYLLPGVGVDMQYYTLPDKVKCSKAKGLLYGAETYVLLSIGELRSNKNQQIILRALGQLKKEGYDISRVRYVLLGTGKDKKRLFRLAEKLHVEKQVDFAGYQRDIRPYLMAADAVAFPSVREGLGMAAIEALAMGVPVLAADNRGTREYMQPSVNGLVYEAKDVKGFADGLKAMMENQKVWQEDLTRKRIRQSVERFQKSCAREVMQHVYRQILMEDNKEACVQISHV